MKKVKTPIWYMLVTVIALAALVYIGMIKPCILLSRGMPFDTLYASANLYIGEKIPPNRFYASSWGEMDFVEGFLFLFLGFWCFILGITRAFNKLSCSQILIISLFTVLFSLMSLSLTEFAAIRFNPEFLFYLFWLTFFSYPIVLFIYFLNCLRIRSRRWLFAPVFILTVYSAAAFVMYFVFGLPFDMPERLYTIISLVSAVVYLTAGVFAAKDKSAAICIRGIVVLWVIWALVLLIKTLAGAEYSLHNEYKSGFLLLVIFMVCYVLLTGTQELVKYKSGMRQMEIKNEFMLENYKAIESHIAGVAELKHEMRHHIFAISTLAEKGEYRHLDEYIIGLQGSFAEIEEPVACGNRLIQAVLGHAARRARELGFEIEFEILPLPDITIPDADLVSLFMNLLDNALESCTKMQNPEERFIKVRLKTREPYLCLSVINSVDAKLRKSENSYTNAKDRTGLNLRGYGIEIVRKIANKYGGLASFEQSETNFKAEVALPLE